MNRPTNYWSEIRDAPESETLAVSGWPRRLALLAGLLLIASFLSVLYHITDVVGGVEWFVLIVGATFVIGTIAARILPFQLGLSVGILLLGLGLGSYLLAIPNAYVALLSFRLLSDLVVLIFGELSLLQITRADLWAIAMAPAPIFGTWYLLLRRHYDLGAWIGGLTLVFFVLTGDASETVARIGITCVLAVFGFGLLDNTDSSWTQIRDVGLLLAVVIVLTRFARPVTARLMASQGDSLTSGATDSSQASTIEASLTNAPNRVGIQGSISLTPEVRFTVTADRPAFWHVAAYDRFTGESWVRSGKSTGYSELLSSPPAESQPLQQTFEAKAPINTMPAAWKPISVGDEVANRTRVTDLGGLQPSRSFSKGDRYSVTSARAQWTESQLRKANGEFPDSIRDRYLQLPNSTPERINRFATELTTDADTRFDKAVVIEQWLEQNKVYSLEVTRPSGNIADAFIFEMDQGYCVYFATAMTVMLRTLGIPARFTVGYTTGQHVADNKWVIRGFNSHTWVEVFFPEVGWVAFNPTPSEPRQTARQQRLEDARAASSSGIDTGQSRPTTTSRPSTTSPSGSTPTTTPSGASPTTGNNSQSNLTHIDEQQGAIVSEQEGGASTDGSGFQRNGQESTGLSRRELFTNLSEDDLVAIFAGVVGVALGISRAGLLRRGLRFIEIRWQSSTDSPKMDVKRAFERLEKILARQYRERQTGETRREYILAAREAGYTDERLQRILGIYELTLYKGEVSRTQADEAIALVDDIAQIYLTLR